MCGKKKKTCNQNFFEKRCTYIRKNLYLCTRFWGLFSSRNRDVAQLVAHYVRDVGVASSNLVIPTVKGLRCWMTVF